MVEFFDCLTYKKNSKHFQGWYSTGNCMIFHGNDSDNAYWEYYQMQLSTKFHWHGSISEERNNKLQMVFNNLSYSSRSVTQSYRFELIF